MDLGPSVGQRDRCRAALLMMGVRCTPVLWGALIASLIALGDVRASAQREVLTLAQAVREAIARSARMVDQRDLVEQANLNAHLARNAFRPKLVPNIQGSFGQTDVSNQSYRFDVSQRFVTGTEVRAGLGATSAQIPSLTGSAEDVRFYNTDTTLSVGQPLLKGFGTTVARRGVASADLQRDEAARQMKRAEQALVIDVATAYYGLIAQRTLLQVGAKSLERSRTLVEAAEARLAAGLVSQLDVLRAQQLVAQSELQLSDIEAAVEDARDQLAFLMGRAADSPFEVSDVIPAAPAPLPADEAVALAFEHRADLQGLVASASDSLRGVSYARNQLLPQVDVNFLLTRRETAKSLADSLHVGRFQFATFFTVAIPVDRTPQLVDYQNALIERDRRQRQLETLRRTITDDVNRAIRDRDRMRRNLSLAESAVEIARKEVEVAQFRYERGLSNNLDLVAAEGNLLSAESRRVSALAEVSVSHLRFRALIGILDPAVDIIDAPPAAPFR